MPSANGRCDGPRFLRDWVPVILALLATFILSSIPGSRLPRLEWNSDKLLHAVEFAVIGALLVRLLGRTSWGASRPAVALLTASVLASVWGALDELHQLLTPYRACDWRDWIADTGGGLLGALAYLRRRGHSRSRLGTPDAGAGGP
jgi:VanZ family protein